MKFFYLQTGLRENQNFKEVFASFCVLGYQIFSVADPVLF